MKEQKEDKNKEDKWTIRIRKEVVPAEFRHDFSTITCMNDTSKNTLHKQICH